MWLTPFMFDYDNNNIIIFIKYIQYYLNIEIIFNQ